jgi:hypothetical protein
MVSMNISTIRRFPAFPPSNTSTPASEQKYREHDGARAKRKPGDDLQGGGHS